MKRVNEFRGKRIDNGEWVTGGVLIIAEYNQSFIIESKNRYVSSTEVIPETVSEFTSLTDNKKNKIYEGDICKKGDAYAIIKYCTKNAAFYASYGNFNYFFGWDINQKDLIVSGNIYDNLDLLNGNLFDTEL